MKKIILINLFLFSLLNVYSQNLDSLYYRYINAVERNVKGLQAVTTGEPAYIKCATDLVHDIKVNFERFDLSKRDKLSSLMVRPDKDTSIVTPSGFFRIHYDKSGTDAPGYSLTELAAALDSAYNFEINILGYPVPPGDNGSGGDNLYDVYLEDEGIIYGYTDFDGISDSPSYIVIDNDFADHYTKGIDGARVTVAHEFFHAIQVGSYLYREDEGYFYEIMSTGMEEFVYDSINDYYAYMPVFFNYPSSSLYATPGGGYDAAIWNIFLKDEFGIGIIKEVLSNIVDMPALESYAAAIGAHGSTFKAEFNKFGIWMFFTKDRAKPGEYFEEAENYPEITPLLKYNFDTSSKSVTVSSNPASNIFIRYSDRSRGLPDTLYTIVTNGDYVTQNRTEFNYTLYNYSAAGASKINDFYYSRISSQKEQLFAESNIFNNEIASEAGTERVEIDFAFPQPFSYGKHRLLSIPAAPEPYGKAYLNVYTSSMDLVFSGEKDIFAADKIVVRWNGLGNDGNKLPTGVYFYVTKSGDTIKKGKLVIYNE